MKNLLAAIIVLLATSAYGTEIIQKLEITTPDGESYAEIKYYDDGTFKITQAASELKADRNGDKRKYKDLQKYERYEVKYSEDGFKLRTPYSRLVSKVKRSDTKIKISDNEENRNPYEIKMDGTERAKINIQDTTIAKVKFYPDTGKLKLKNAENQELFICESKQLIPGLAVLAVANLSELEQLILFAELAAP